jgi:peptide/nickel transport system ATP-binding protein
MMDAPVPLLAVDDLGVEFRTRDGDVRALERVGFDVRPGETLGVVGESGSGKSVTALAVLGILPRAARVTSGRIAFRGRDLLAADEAERRGLRGLAMSMVFQSPRAALNPIRPVGRQIEDVLRRHSGLSRGAARDRALELLARVQVGDPVRRARAYPFELSGGLCQRVMIAIAIAAEPALLIADEPTTGLDVTTQAAVLDLLAELGRERGMATVLITHDLAVVAERCERIVVMHAGHVLERARTADLFAAPRHHYTARLIATTPRAGAKLGDLHPIPGSVPDLRGRLGPCRYRARCDAAAAVCDEQTLPSRAVGADHVVACHFPR